MLVYHIKSEPSITLAVLNLHPKPGVKSLLFSYVCSVFSDRLLKWSKKDGFYTSFQVPEAFVFYQSKCILILFPQNVTSLILGDSGIFYQVSRANGCQNMICQERSLKHIPGQSLKTITF